MTIYDAIIPAGGELDAEFAKLVGTSSKALIPFGHETVLERIVAALRASGRVRRIAIVGPQTVRDSRGGQLCDFRVEAGNSGPDSIQRGLDALDRTDSPPDKVLVVTCDLPYLTSAIIDGFLNDCPAETAICLPLIGKQEYEARFPGATATFVTLKDGTWTAGCMYLLDTQALKRSRPYLEQVFQARKSKLAMAKLLGPVFLCKFATKSLTVHDVENKILRMLNCSGRAIIGSAPELAFDLDYQDDYDYAVRHLEGAV